MVYTYSNAFFKCKKEIMTCIIKWMNYYARFKFVSHRKTNTALYEILRFVKLIKIIQWIPEAREMGNRELCNGYRVSYLHDGKD